MLHLTGTSKQRICSFLLSSVILLYVEWLTCSLWQLMMTHAVVFCLPYSVSEIPVWSCIQSAPSLSLVRYPDLPGCLTGLASLLAFQDHV